MLRSISTMLNGSSRLSRRMAGRIVYRLLSRPRRYKLSAPEIQLLDKAERRPFQLDGERIQTYTWRGGDRSVLLAHGWESSSARWAEQVHHLQEAGFTVYALDGPAHGRSSGHHFTVLHYARALGMVAEAFRPTHLVGHSAGGMAAVYYLTHHDLAHRPERLALLATPAELSDFIDVFGRTLNLKPVVMNALEDIFRERLEKPFSYYSIARFAGRLDMPGLVIHDREDDIAPFDGGRAIHHNWQNSHFMATEGLGHSLLHESVIGRVTEFLSDR